MRVVSLVSNSLAFDVRAKRHITALAEAGLEVVCVSIEPDGHNSMQDLPTAPNLAHVLVPRMASDFPRGTANWLRSGAEHRLSRLLWSRGVRTAWSRDRFISSSYSILARVVRRIRADVYYANGLNTTAIASRVAKIHDAVTVYDAFELYTGESLDMPPAVYEARLEAEGLACRKAAEVLTVSRQVADAVAELYDVRTPRVIRNLPPLVKLRTPEPRSGQPLRILFQTANLHLHGRNVKVLIDAVARVSRLFHLTLRGHCRTPDLQAELTAYLERTLRAGQWRVMPAVSYAEMIQDTINYDVGVVLNDPRNQNEAVTLPNKLFEYMMAGVAVVTLDTPPVTEIVRKEAVGLVAGSNTADGLASCFLRYSEDQELLRNHKSQGRLRAVEEYNWDREKEKLVEAVTQAARGVTQRRLS